MTNLPDRLVVASHNRGKVREFMDLLEPLGVAVSGASVLGLEEPEETGETYEQNARLKSTLAAHSSGMPALADDSGLSVNALNGAPGVFSARWSMPGRDFARAMMRLAHELDGLADRSASFRCVLVLSWPDGKRIVARGSVDGAIVFPPRGNRGFGYDPVFVPQGHTRTYGEMSRAEKEKDNHRTRAFSDLLRQL